MNARYVGLLCQKLLPSSVLDVSLLIIFVILQKSGNTVKHSDLMHINRGSKKRNEATLNLWE